MSRYEETMDTLKEIMSDGAVDWRAALISELGDIALSVAVIADKLTEGNSNDGAGSEADHS